LLVNPGTQSLFLLLINFLIIDQRILKVDGTGVRQQRWASLLLLSIMMDTVTLSGGPIRKEGSRGGARAGWGAAQHLGLLIRLLPWPHIPLPQQT
jgi:hypothetical protein